MEQTSEQIREQEIAKFWEALEREDEEFRANPNKFVARFRDNEKEPTQLTVRCKGRSVIVLEDDFNAVANSIDERKGIVCGEFSPQYLGLLIRAATDNFGFHDLARTLSRVKVIGASYYRVNKVNE